MTTEKTENITTKSPSGRPKRKPMGATNRLSFVGQDFEKWNYRVVNMSPGRVERLKEAGYEIAPEGYAQERIEGGKTVEGSLSVGGGMTAVLMRQPREFYEEDKAAKRHKVNRQMEAIQKDIPKNNPDSNGSYGSVSFEK